MTPGAALSAEARPTVGQFLMEAMPEYADGIWDDMFSTPWQFSGMALAALGYAADGDHSAWHRLDPPTVPDQLPRWDDIAQVVLTVLLQRGEIEYRISDGSRHVRPPSPDQFVIRQIDPPPPEPPKPNIAAAHGCGPASLAADRMPLLEVLGLVADGAWTQDAELALWREQPRAWEMEVTADPRFHKGLDLCLSTMSEEVVETMHDLAEVTPEDVYAAVARQEQANAELIRKYPAQAKFDRTVTRDGQFHSLIFDAKHQMNDLFFAGWRLLEGWLAPTEQSRALPLFHDPLAMDMRKAAFTEMGLAFPAEVPR